MQRREAPIALRRWKEEALQPREQLGHRETRPLRAARDGVGFDPGCAGSCRTHH